MTVHATENVADYPRPPRLEAFPYRVQVVLGGALIVDTMQAWRVLETFHPPSYYIPRDAFASGTLTPAPGGSTCEWKGRASYHSLEAGGRRAENAGWSYERPTPGFAAIAGHVAVYCQAMDACFVDGEQATPQPGGFYGGWVTSWITGPIKGAPGTTHW
jgi:uncharacterized protein (DUF427 family)